MLIKDLFQNWKVPSRSTKRRTQRGDLLDEFLNELNPPRVESGYKELSHAWLSKILKDKKITNEESMYVFYQECKRSNNFSKYFWWKLKQ